MIRGRVGVTVEELANVATHGFGLLASLAAFPILVLLAAQRGDAGVIVGVTIFAATLVGAYAASTMYHALPPGPRKDMWKRLDQTAVYLLIAGTYTPFTLGALRGPWGWTLLATIWTAALIGIVIKVGFRAQAPTLETVTYLGMGWLVVVAAEPLLQRIGWAGLAWLLAGGIAYTIGTVFLVCQARVRFGHCAWHVFVLGGSACHAIAVVNYGLTLPS
ncbi:MAG: hemolysin III family protein [Gemmatimonadaceae bacterium]